MVSDSFDPAPDFVPEFAIQVPDDDGSVLAYVAIDSISNGRCSGGIRMCGDLVRSEIRGLANSMTWKFRFMNNPVGGAKSGLLCPVDADSPERVRRLELFGRRIRPLLHSMYTLGGDIGVGPDEVAVVRRAAGLPAPRKAGTHRGGYYTGYGVFVSIMTWLSEAEIDARDATVVLEGYGNVGRPLARLLKDANVRVTGISTEAGALIDDSGLDIDEMENLSGRYGARCTLEYSKADRCSPPELFGQRATVIVPGARAWSIHAGNVSGIDVQAVIPAANIPITPDAARQLEDRGVCVVPDFVCNSGGIFGSGLLNRGFGEDATRRLVTRVYGSRLKALLHVQRRTGGSLRDIAIDACRRRQQDMSRARRSRLAKLRAQLLQGNGLINLMRRSALEIYYRGYQITGSSVTHIPEVVKRAAEEAVFDRATRSTRYLR